MNLKKKLTLKPYGNTTVRYATLFTSPTNDFLLVLEGKTKFGHLFRRLARGIVKPTTALIQKLYAPRGFVVETGSLRDTTILLAIHNFGKREFFKLKVLEKQKFAQDFTSPRVFAMRGLLTVFTVRYIAPKNAKSGSTHKSVVVAEGEKSKVKISILIVLLVK